MAIVLESYRPGLELLAKAQEKSYCVFEHDLRWFGFEPHSDAAVDSAKVLSIAGRHSLELGDVDGAINCVESMLRLSRDLRLRGNIGVQVNANRFEGMVCVTPPGDQGLIQRLLAAPGLKTAQCDELLSILDRNQKERIDGIMEAYRTEYITSHFILRDLQMGTYGQVLKDNLDFSGPVDSPKDYLTHILQMTGRSTPPLKQHAVISNFLGGSNSEIAKG